jgi:hypothetical protein
LTIDGAEKDKAEDIDKIAEMLTMTQKAQKEKNEHTHLLLS